MRRSSSWKRGSSRSGSHDELTLAKTICVWRCCRFGFPFKALLGYSIAEVIWRQELDGHFAIQALYILRDRGGLNHPGHAVATKLRLVLAACSSHFLGPRAFCLGDGSAWNLPAAAPGTDRLEGGNIFSGMCTHRAQLTSPTDVDADVIDWLK